MFINKISKKGRWLLLLVFLFSRVSVASGLEQKALLSDLEVSAGASIYSEYIWRGMKIDDDPVIQSDLSLGYKGLSVGIWSSLGLDGDDANDSDEIDYTVSYSYDCSKLGVPTSFELGGTYYDFPSADTFSYEFFLGASVGCLLSPALYWYHDFADEGSGGGDGDYVEFSIGYEQQIMSFPISLVLGSHVGYNHELFIEGEGLDIGAEASLDISIKDNISLIPTIGYSVPFEDLEDASDGNQNDEFYAGCSLNFEI
ncbi:MAG: TorF family putative porin [Candidatus Omnitrophota bacterium]